MKNKDYWKGYFEAIIALNENLSTTVLFDSFKDGIVSIKYLIGYDDNGEVYSDHLFGVENLNIFDVYNTIEEFRFEDDHGMKIDEHFEIDR